MKYKGINWFERNVEKIVVGVAGTALLGIGVMQLMLQPNTVTIDKKSYPPQEAMKAAEVEAEALLRRMEVKDAPPLQAVELNLGKTLSDGLAARVSPRPRLATDLGSKPGIGTSETKVLAESVYAELAVPKPTEAVAAAFRSTISPLEQIRNPELAKVLPAQQPFDKAAVSIGATFSGAALREALVHDPDGEAGPVQPIAANWWREPGGRELVEVIAVQVEREVVVAAEGSKEKAGSKKIIEPLPGLGRVNPVAFWGESVKSVGDVYSALGAFRQMAEQVERPKYYSTIAGPAWIEPSEMVKANEEGGKQRRIDSLRKRLELVNEKIVDLDKRIAQAPAVGGERPPPPPRSPPPGGGKGGPSGPPPTSAPAPKTGAPGGDKRALENAKKKAESDKANLEKQLGDLGEKVATSLATPTIINLLDDPEVKIWSHDVTVEPGATYRYHVRVAVNNPFYGRNVKASQLKLTEASLVWSDWSEWTAPVEVDRSDYFFVTSAADRGPASPAPRANAELFVFYYGYWRRAQVSLEPGDPLSGEATLPDTLALYDLKKLATLDRDPNAVMPGVAPPPPPPPGGGERGEGGRKGTLPSPSPSPTPAQPQYGSDPSSGASVLDNVDKTFAKTKRTLSVDAVFIDVTKSIAGAGATAKEVMDAVLRDDIGRVVVKSPEYDKAGDRYKRLDISANAGKTQGKPVIKDEGKPAPIGPKPEDLPKPPKQPPAPPPNRGGGGG